MNELKTIMNSSLQHMKFTDEMKERVLEEGRKAEKHKSFVKQKSFSRYAVPVAACLVLCVGTTVAAKALLWDKYVAEKYNIEENEQIQEETVDDGLVNQAGAVAEDNGVKIEVIQTVATDNYLDLYLKIQAENEEIAKQLADMNPEYEISFENSIAAGGGGGMENYYTGEGLKTVAVPGEAKENQIEGLEYEIYNIYTHISPDSKLNGDTVHLKINSFVGNSQTSPDKVLEGNWELSWTIQASETKKTLVFDKEYTIYGKSFKLNKVELNTTGCVYYLDRQSVDAQGLMNADVYMVQSPEQREKGPAGLGEYESAEWRGICGIPLEVSKNLTEQERNDVFDQVKAGTYQGEYMEYTDWCLDDDGQVIDNHTIISPWDYIYIQYEDGTYFTPENDSGFIKDMENEYVCTMNYVGYLDISKVSAIQLGDCVIPLSDATEE